MSVVGINDEHSQASGAGDGFIMSVTASAEPSSSDAALDASSVPSMSAMVSAPTPSTSLDQSASVPVSASSHRQWASRGRRTSAAAARRRTHVDTSSDISAVAQAQAAYYKRQLEIAELQHQMFAAQHLQKMATLQVQHKYYAAKLCRLEE